MILSFDNLPLLMFPIFSQLDINHPMEYTSDRHHESQRKHIVLAIWVIVFLQVSVSKSMGVLLPVLLDQFAADTRNVGVVVSLIFFSGNLIGNCLSRKMPCWHGWCDIVVCTLRSFCRRCQFVFLCFLLF